MAQIQQSQPADDTTKSHENGDAIEDRTKAISEVTLKDTVQDATLLEQMQTKKDSSEVSQVNTEHVTECHLPNNKSEAITGESVKFTDLDTSNNLCFDSQDTEAKKFDDNEIGSVEVLASMDVRELSDDFATTFMLDEEIELEHKMLRKTDLSSTRR